MGPLPGLEDQDAMTIRGAPTESGDGSGLETRGGHWVSTPGSCPLVLRPFHPLHGGWWKQAQEMMCLEPWEETSRGWESGVRVESGGALLFLSLRQGLKSGEPEEGVSLRKHRFAHPVNSRVLMVFSITIFPGTRDATSPGPAPDRP